MKESREGQTGNFVRSPLFFLTWPRRPPQNRHPSLCSILPIPPVVLHHAAAKTTGNPLDFSPLLTAIPLILPSPQTSKTLVPNLGNIRGEITMLWSVWATNWGHRMCTQAWPYNLVSSYFNCPINWVLIHCIEHPSQP